MLEALAAVLRAALYAGVLSCAGAVFATRSLQAPELFRVAIPLIRRSAWLAIAASLGGVLILVLRLGGQLDEPTLSAVLNSGFGASTAMQLAGAGLLLASLTDPTAKTMRLAHAALMTLSFAISGHAAAADLANGLLAFVHASAAAWWIGSLWLLRYASNQSDFAVIEHAVRRFSALAVILVGVLVLAALMLIRALLNFANLPILSAYEQTLLVKIGIVACVLGVAAFNKFRLTPRLISGDAAAVSSLRTMINLELVLMGVVIAATAILTTYTSPPD
jgi:putative copper resistance protein D